MFSRILKYPDNKSFFLFGPRGTGKTTWTRNTFPDAIYIDLLEAEVFNKLLANPQRLGQWIPAGFSNHVVIDEIQRVPELLNEVHRLIETEKYKFILTGSSSRKLKRKGAANLLAGRALTLFMHPLCVKELGNVFDLNRSLSHGHLPSVFSEKEPARYLESYIKTYLDQELRDEGLSRNLPAFARFLESASFSQGSVLNMAEVARDCAIERKTVENYFTILEDLLIAYRVPVFSKRAKRRLLVHPKFYFFDAGVYRTIRPMGPLDKPDEALGIALETLFFQELVALNNCLNLGYKIYYWRTAENAEVDFILYGNRGMHAFEITKSDRCSDKDLKGLKLFLSDYPVAHAHFIYGGNRKLNSGEIDIIPIREALLQMEKILT